MQKGPKSKGKCGNKKSSVLCLRVHVVAGKIANEGKVKEKHGEKVKERDKKNNNGKENCCRRECVRFALAPFGSFVSSIWSFARRFSRCLPPQHHFHFSHDRNETKRQVGESYNTTATTTPFYILNGIICRNEKILNVKIEEKRKRWKTIKVCVPVIDSLHALFNFMILNEWHLFCCWGKSRVLLAQPFNLNLRE